MLANYNLSTMQMKLINIRYMKSQLKHLMIVLLLLAAGHISRAQNVTLIVQNPEVCSGQQTAFSAAVTNPPAGTTVTGFTWNISGNAPVNSSTGSYIFAYPPGIYTISVTANFSGGGSATSSTENFTVYHLPVPSLSVNTSRVQCFRGNEFIFQNNSTQNTSQPSNPLNFFRIAFGDGVLLDFPAGTPVVTHSYNAANQYTPFIRIFDSKGCFSDQFLNANSIIVKPNIAPDFSWVMTEGPCFRSCYRFTNTSVPPVGQIETYAWDFGDGTVKSYNTAQDPSQYNSTTHCYETNGQFNPALILRDTTGCIDSTRKIPTNTTIDLPYNIRFEFDVTVVKNKDTVCAQSGEGGEICYKMTPISFARPGTGDFVWNFGDPNDPTNQNLDSNSWEPCHSYSGMGHFLPRITIKNVCPDTTFFYFSAVSVNGTPMDRKTWFPDHDLGANNTPPPPTNAVPYLFRKPMDTDTINFTPTGVVRWTVPDSVLLYEYVSDYTRPAFFFRHNDPRIGNGTTPIQLPWNVLNDSLNLGYGVFVIGPVGQIEDPPNQILIAQYQKLQCEGRDTVDFVNTQSGYKSRYVWRVWDFDDDFAPICTSFSRPINPAQLVFQTAVDQDRNSFHFFKLGNKVYPGKMNCKFSFDTLPRHKYPTWPQVLEWYKNGKDFMPWDDVNFTKGTPGAGQTKVPNEDTLWWGKPVYLNIVTGEWSLDTGSSNINYFITQETYFDSAFGGPVTRDIVVYSATPINTPWPRIDNLPLEINNNQDFQGTFQNIQMQQIPDPVAIQRGEQNYQQYNISGTMNAGWLSLRNYPRGIAVLTPNTVLNSGETMYDYAFYRSIQRSYTVRQTVRDSSNNESGDGRIHDIYVLDDKDCRGEGTATLTFARPDARGLGLSGLICPGSAAANFGAQIRLHTGRTGNYPGFMPNTGQTFIIMNLDSLADRMDNTPCDLDGFTTWEGGITAGGLARPGFNTLPDYFPFPPGPWMNAQNTVNIYHYDPAPGAPMPLPADPQGWVTIGVAIGNGSKEYIVTGVSIAAFNASPGTFTAPITNIPVVNPIRPQDSISYTPSPGGFYNFAYSHMINQRTVLGQDVADLVYFDDNFPNCVSNVVWYHRFLRVIDVGATFQEFPQGCFHRGKGDTITVYYNDSLQDSIKYSVWVWGDGTMTVDSFWYSGDTITDSYFHHGIRRVRYNIDMLTDEVMDSTVWPIFASGIGATDGLRPRQKFAVVPYLTQNACTGQPRLNPPTYIADTALMFFPVQHVFKRTSWQASTFINLNDTIDDQGNPIVWTPEAIEAERKFKLDNSTPGFLIHVMVTTGQCRSRDFKLLPIGVIDTFTTRKDNFDGEYDTVFCENETIFFRDSVRYWRFDCQLSDPTDNPGRSRPRVGQSPIVFDQFDPRALLHIDPYDFWRQAEFDPNQVKDPYSTEIIFWNLGLGRFDTIRRTGPVFAETMYWDFGDGNTYKGTRPTHKYSGFGRYRVEMVTMDSLGFWDTCVSFVNIVKPIASIYTPKDIYACSEITEFIDTSFIDFGTGPTTTDAVKNNYWWFGENKSDTVTPVSINRQTVNWLYRTNGPFTVKLVVETEQGCYDTAYQEIFIQGPRPGYRLITDTIGCAPLRVRIINTADSAGQRTPSDTPTVETIIYWGDGNSTSVLGRFDTVEHVYQSEGVFSIVAAGRDAISPAPVNCSIVYFPDTVDGFNAPVNIYIYKYAKEITGDKQALCVGEELEITNTSDSNFTAFRYFVYQLPDEILLDSFNVNGPATSNNPILSTRIFDSTGLYRIVSVPTSFSANIPPEAYDNCRVTDTIEVVVSGPTADFDIDSTDVPAFKFTNTSKNAVRYEWWLYKTDNPANILQTKLGSTSDPNWSFDLGNELGDFVVCLKAFSPDSLGSCEDTICKPIINQFTTDIKLFNVFTPNGDNVNDLFVVDISNEVLFEIVIFNRWGGKVFESNDKNKSWNGRVNNEGNESPAGVYYYIINYQLRAQDPKTVNGSVTLIR
jgi:gliding motility-associated-like protein